MICFHVAGIPKGQPRPRAFARKFGNTFSARMYDPGTAEAWKAAIAAEAAKFMPKSPFSVPLVVVLDFRLPRPKRLCRKCDDPGEVWATCKPDVDNLAKAVFDALTAIGMWADDALVVKTTIRKQYHAIGNRPGATITVDSL